MTNEPVENPEIYSQTTPKKEKKPTPIWRTIIEALVIMALVHTLFYRPFFIPSGSMKPNLLVGDYILINKFTYGFSRYSCYFAACPISGRIFQFNEPERGDVIVFANPGERNHNLTYVKRLVGMPGDKIQMKNGQLFINEQPAPLEALPAYAESLSDFHHETVCQEQDAEYCYIEQFRETLPNNYSYDIFNLVNDGRADNTQEWIVPEKHYFFMGDNRDNSNDSRIDVGMVSEERIIGRADFIVFSSSGNSLFQFWNWRSDRYFERIK